MSDKYCAPCHETLLIRFEADKMFNELSTFWPQNDCLPQHDSFPDLDKLDKPTTTFDLQFCLPFVGRENSLLSYQEAVKAVFDSWSYASDNSKDQDLDSFPACLVMGSSGVGKTKFCHYAPQHIADLDSADNIGKACRFSIDNHLNIRISYKDELIT